MRRPGKSGDRAVRRGGSRQPVAGQGFDRLSFASFFDDRGSVRIADVTQALGISKSQLAETAGFSREVLYRQSRLTAQKTQTRLIEMLEVIGRVSDWAGGHKQALAWYRAQPIPALGARTAESLVKSGEAGLVRDYLDQIALGGYA